MHKNVIKILCMKSFLLKFISSLETFAIKKIRKVVLIYGQYDNCKTIQISDVKKMCFVVGLFSIGIIFYIRHLINNKNCKISTHNYYIIIRFCKLKLSIPTNCILQLHAFDPINIILLFMYFFFKLLLLIGKKL